jgi:hypothetical protein
VRIPRRFDDHTRFLTLDEVRSLILEDPILKRLQEIGSEIVELRRTSPAPVATIEPVRQTGSGMKPQRLHLARREAILKEVHTRPTFWLIAVPAPLADNQPLLDVSEKLHQLLLEPPHVRPTGWNLRAGKEPVTEEWGIAARSRLLQGGLAIGWDGHCEFWAGAKSDFFQWAYVQIRTQRPFYLDARAFVEPIVCFMRLIREVAQLLASANAAPERVHLAASFLNCEGAMLVHAPPGSVGHRFAISDPDDNDVGKLKGPHLDVQPFDIPIEEVGDAAAYKLVQRIYRLFGFANPTVPYFDAQLAFTGTG